MRRGPDIIAVVHFYPSEQGGRKGPTPPRIFRCPLEFEGEKFDCGLHLEEIGAIAPGITATVPITLLFPELLKSRLKVGSQFKLWELGEIADGVVEKVIAD
ncbi:MAG: hypothetical protein U1E28_02045 [Beijerinckiaceae bacterium]